MMAHISITSKIRQLCLAFIKRSVMFGGYLEAKLTLKVLSFFMADVDVMTPFGDDDFGDIRGGLDVDKGDSDAKTFDVIGSRSRNGVDKIFRWLRQ